jgi:hypothetical protein
VGHLQHDFDTGTRLSGICLYVTIVLLRLCSFYPKPSIAILARSAQIRKELLVIWLYFYLPDTFYRHSTPVSISRIFQGLELVI